MNSSKKHINFALIDEQIQQDTNPIDTIVNNIKIYSQQNGNLLQKYNQEFYLTYFDRNIINQTIIKLGSHQQQKKQLKLQQFIRAFLSFIQHQEHQTLFLAMSLRNLFLKIKENTKNQIGVKFSDFTNFLCQRIAKQNPDLIVPLKQVPQQKINPDVQRIRQIDINPPLVLKSGQSDLPRIAKQKKKKDKKLIQRKPVSKFVYNSLSNQIITVGRLSSCIHFYDMELKKLPTQIIPKTYKDISRQIAILSMDFDEQNQRIGAVINGIGISFWQASDKFDTQKTISKYQGQKIYYLKLFKEWITSDKNTIYFWDIKQEAVKNKIVNEQSCIINDICEVNHLRCICVSYTLIDDSKIFIVYKNHKPIARYDMGSSGCHSLYYNIGSQMIITAGYHNQLEVFEVENNTYSINLKKQLKGHSSIVSCVTDIKNTNFILSGDDSGQVRIWELNYMKCIQVVKVSKYINDLFCTGTKLIFTDSRLNTMQMDKFSLPYVNDEQIIFNFFQEETYMQFAITRKSIRKINFNNGRVQMIFVVCQEQEQVSSAIRISTGILIGTSKGFMKLFTFQGKNKWEINAHDGQITQLKYDRKTRFIFSLGADNKLMIWPQKTILQDGVKKIITFKNKNFNLFALFNQIRLLFLGSTQQSQICVWDYENLKLLTIIKLTSPIIFMEINHLYRILMISTVYDELCFFKLLWKAGYLDYQILYNGDSGFSGLKKDRKVKYGLSIEADSLLKNQVIEQNGLRKTKKQKTQKQIGSKRIINHPDKKQCDIFITSSKIQNEKIKQQNGTKKSCIKISTVNVDTNQLNNNQYMCMPSIKLIKQQSSIKQQKKQLFTSQTEGTLGTLKSLKRLDNQITTRIQIKQTQDLTLLIIGNSKGCVSCYNISYLIKQHFIQYEIPLKKNQSPHIYRPGKQDYDQEINKHHFNTLQLQNIPKVQKVKKSYFKLLWRQNCHNKQPISYLSFIQMKNTYLCVSMIDGYCKYFDLQSSTLKGNLKINLPLPIYWDIKIQNDLYIKKNLYETLIVLDKILTNHGFQMLSKQYKAINVTKFLQLLKKKNFLKHKAFSKKKIQPLKQEKKVTLLHEEYSIEDMKKISHGMKQTLNNQNTLKSLEAYKRVKQIKQQMNLQIRNSMQQKDDGIKKLSNEVLRQKQQIQRLFSPNYFTVLGEHGTSSQVNKSVQLGSLQERSIILLQKINKNKKKLYSQYAFNKPTDSKLKRQASLLPTLPTIRSQLIQTKTDEQEISKDNNSLVRKFTNSLSTIVCPVKPKNIQLVSIYSKDNLSSSIFKNSSSISKHQSKILNLSKLTQKKYKSILNDKQNQTKNNKHQDMTKRSILQDKTTRQILNEINDKLHRYKKSNYAKRDII